ncbi:MAG: ABC transporter substrate-binding protein [Acetobacteraceae bacterium]|nr:ABC transporter substrate-binding protein [Acetobacteraceae bacterium]
MPTGNTPIGRRTALKLPLLGAAAATGLVRRANGQPVPGRAAERTLHFVPYSNLIVMDPVWSISIIGLEHAYMTCDQLYGLDDTFTPQPQMAAGHALSDDKLVWRFTLRDGLLFHDGEPVRANDCVASIARWAKRDPFGQRMIALADEMKVLDDRRFEIRLKRPYAHMLYGLGATTCFIRPERLARTDPYKAITDQTGSGPFRFLDDEFVTGSRAVYARHTGYVPRQEKPAMWSGGKMAYFDRVEWHILPDAATAAAALQTGEVDWVERPLLDLVPKLKTVAGVTVEQVDPMGFFAILWLNNAAPPFDNPKLRHAILPAINQQDFMLAVVGDQPQQLRTGMGMFTPGSPFASDAGMEIINGKRDLALAKRLIAESGYKGEKIVLMAPELPESHAMAEVTHTLFQQLGLNVDYQTMDFGTLSARARSTDPAVSAGWSCYCIGWAGLWPSNPGSNVPLVGVRPNPKMDALRSDWFDAPDLPAQKQIADRMQLLGFEDPPFLPLGQYFVPYAYRTGLTGFVRAPITALWNVRRA